MKSAIATAAMLSLLHPAALWTLAALALPLAIHLRRPPPRTVRLGSLRFLENAPRRLWRNPRWRELLLLCARMGLLAALALLLAEPRWIDTPPAGPRRWALLDPTAVLTGDALARWQAARADGFEPHHLAPGFPTAPDEPTAGSNDLAAPDLWSLLSEADAELPAGSMLAVFSRAVWQRCGATVRRWPIARLTGSKRPTSPADSPMSGLPTPRRSGFSKDVATCGRRCLR